MLGKKTKAELLEEVSEVRMKYANETADLANKITALENQVRIKSSELASAQRELDRCKDAMREGARTDACVRAAIASRLATSYGKRVEPQCEWFRGQEVAEEGITEEVRFLRNLYQMIGSDMPPF